MNYINSIVEAIGKTPLLKLNKIGRETGANIFVKLEYLNPSGSYKDRMAKAMVDAAERGETWNGKKLSAGGTIVEASAGNTAPAVALQCAARGYKSKLYLYRYSMKDGKDARMKIVDAYGPDVNLSSEPSVYLNAEDLMRYSAIDADMPHVMAAKMDCALDEANSENTVWLDQIYNDANVEGQKTLGQEIYEQLDGKIDAIGCSVGSGATLYGMCLALQEKGLKPEITFGVVPFGSENYIVLDHDECGRGDFSVSVLDKAIAKTIGLEKWTTEKAIAEKMIDDGYPDLFFQVTEQTAREMANRLCREEGIYCGMSSGANVAVAVKIAQRLGAGKNVVTTLVDRRDRYLEEYPNDIYVV